MPVKRERINSLGLRAFRGVPGELEFDLAGKSLLVLGANGTGKSSISDALEFFFTGGVEFLAREGRQVFNHISASAEKTEVQVTTTGSLSGTATPSLPAESAVSIGQEENFMLRGRLLAEFVDKTKGDKWKYLFSLLGLSPVEKLRQDLQRARNALDDEHTEAAGKAATASAALSRLCPLVTESGLLERIQGACQRAGAPLPETLDAALRFDWLSAFGQRDDLIKREAQLGALALGVPAQRSTPGKAYVGAWNDVLDNMQGDRSRLQILKAGRDILRSDPTICLCPLCSQPVDRDVLETQIRAALTGMERYAGAFERAQRSMNTAAKEIETAWSLHDQVRTRAYALDVALDPLPSSPAPGLREKVQQGNPILSTELDGSWDALMAWGLAARQAINAARPSLGDSDAALGEVLKLVQLGREWHTTSLLGEYARRAKDLADAIYDTYAEVQGDYFQSVLDAISVRLAEIYTRLHPDEGLRGVGLAQWGEKGVELKLEFHGHSMSPPHAVISESHLNSLGIAIFLAMAEVFNERLGFLVLDDVVNSFDGSHRGALAELLAAEYDDWQLIILTHDQLFYNRLARLKPGWGKVELTSWSFEEGPRIGTFETGLLLERAQIALRVGDIHGAATKLRRYVEELLQEACEGVQGEVPFRRGFKNDRREIGELIKGVRRGLKTLGGLQPFEALLSSIETDVQTVFNVEAHASDVWPSVAEVERALARAQELDAAWRCSSCGSRVWSRGSPPVVTCRCGETGLPRPQTRQRPPVPGRDFGAGG